MLDLIFAVENARAWHEANMMMNRSHYSGLARLCGSQAVAKLQEGFGARMYFNNGVCISKGRHRERPMKYGVITTRDLLLDLREWHWLYASGRMHKPVNIIKDEPFVKAAADKNLRSALSAALLTLPPRFDAEMLFTAIAALSYTGDFRMGIGENPNKVQNIVRASMSRFHKLYDPTLHSLRGLASISHESSQFEQDTSLTWKSTLANVLPAGLHHWFPQGHRGGHNAIPFEARGAAIRSGINRGIANIVRASSRRQGAKGLLTVPLGNCCSIASCHLMISLTIFSAR
ncbi:unnamed protein product [Chrysoparadoxa australica]